MADSRKSSLESWEDTAEAVVKELKRLQATVSEAEKVRRKRFWQLVAVFVISVVTAIQLHDLHVEHCMVWGQPDTPSERHLCDMFFPTHEHEPFDTADPQEVLKWLRRGHIEKAN